LLEEEVFAGCCCSVAADKVDEKAFVKDFWVEWRFGMTGNGEKKDLKGKRGNFLDFYLFISYY
jgi:hypothetical protein